MQKKNEVNILGHTWHTTVGVPFILFMVVCDTKACAYCDKPGTVKEVIDIHFYIIYFGTFGKQCTRVCRFSEQV